MSVLNRMHKETPSTIEAEPNMFIEAARDIGDDMQDHFHDIREYNHAKMRLRRTFMTRMGQHAVNSGRAVAYTSYFWLDDYLMRPISNAIPNQTASIAAVGTLSTALGGTLALIRRRQLKDMYLSQGVEVEDEHPRLVHAGTASILGAPHTVKQMAVESKSSESIDVDDESILPDMEEVEEEGIHPNSEDVIEISGTDGQKRKVRLMTVGAIGFAASVYGYLQGYTAGPLIDKIDEVIPGEGFLMGDVPAVTAFVVPAIYLKSLGSVWYNRRKVEKQKQPSNIEPQRAA